MPRVTQVRVTRSLRKAEEVTREGGLWAESEELHCLLKGPVRPQWSKAEVGSQDAGSRLSGAVRGSERRHPDRASMAGTHVLRRRVVMP